MDSVLEKAGILEYFDPDLRVYSSDVGLKKDSQEIFSKAAEAAGEAPSACVFVGEDPVERGHASAAGLQICPHPLLVEAIIDGQVLRYLRISADGASLPWNVIREAERELVPLQVVGRSRSVLYAMAAESVLPRLAAAHLRVDFLGTPNLPATAELFLQREAAGLMASAERDLVVGTAPEGLVIALPAGRTLAEIHMETMRHGHTLKLVPDPQLIAALPPFPSTFLPTTAPEPLAPDVADAFGDLAGDSIRRLVDRYAGETDLPDGRPVLSRHLAHPDNLRAVEAIAADLAAVAPGQIAVRMHRFSHRGRELFNVEGEISGHSSEMVLLTAHLDSTAANSPPYDEERDSAPGADDDASGVAGVLAAAECIARLSKATRPQRTTRFVLFNAEEEGLVGSRAYARLQRARGAAIAGVFQMDMIGFNRVDPRSWEIHLGCRTSPDVEAASLPLAVALRQAAAQVSPRIAAPQIYRSGPGIGDPADGRSDHSSFHAYGYPALCASEDFFVGPNPDSPDPESNPHYHQHDDNFVDPDYAADIARAVAAAAWQLAVTAPSRVPVSRAFSSMEHAMPTSREFDSRRNPRTAARTTAARETAAPQRFNAITGTPFTAHAASDDVSQSFVDKAMSFMRSQTFAAVDGSADYVPDPAVQRTSTGAAAVNLHQFYRGIPVFQMTRTVRFDPQGRPTEALGDNATLPHHISTEPHMSATDAVKIAANFLAETGTGGTIRSQYGDEYPTPTVDVSEYRPEIAFRFPLLPAAPTIVSKGPFENDVPTFLVIFVHPGAPRLGWYMTLTLPDYTDQYVIIVAADSPSGEVLYSHSSMHRAKGRGHVYEFSPGTEPRREVSFPRPLAEYPIMPTSPIAMFPQDWIGDDGRAIGNSTIATLGSSTTTLTGTPQGDGSFLFEPADENGDEQKILNIFYFCNYMHDFLYILGFDEASGNFQRINLTNEGLGNDPVRARAHSGSVFGTANMATGPDGLPPVMNMGLVVGSGRHTAFDFDVVAHEYVHGLTNRLVGGRMNANALDELQSGGMGEGWSDYFALTIQSYFQNNEKVVSGDWVVDSPGGIRRAPYDDNYPFSFGQLSEFPEVHDIGEVWCAALMKMTRLIRTTLGDDNSGYRLAWQLVVDALKLTPPNPTFLDGRDAIFRTLDDMVSAGRLSASVHARVQTAMWQAFASFGMGAGASCPDAGVDGIVADDSVPMPSMV